MINHGESSDENDDQMEDHANISVIENGFCPTGKKIEQDHEPQDTKAILDLFIELNGITGSD